MKKFTFIAAFLLTFQLTAVCLSQTDSSYTAVNGAVLNIVQVIFELLGFKSALAGSIVVLLGVVLRFLEKKYLKNNIANELEGLDHNMNQSHSHLFKDLIEKLRGKKK